MTVLIREESVADYAAVYKLLVDAFGQEDEAKLVDRLREDSCFIPELSLVAHLDEKIVGHILFSRINIAENNITHPSLALAPVAVDPDYQGKGIGGELIIEGHRRALLLGYSSVIVLGHEHYYPRFGYKPASFWNIRCPFTVPDELFMGMELKPDSLKGISGVVEYAEAFSSEDL